MNFHFTSLQDRSQLTELVNFLILQNLGYPRYENWVQKAEHELDLGQKGAILAFSEGKLVGDVIYQPLKENPLFLEVKNLRINPEFRMRDFGRFMLRQVEAENKQCDAAICDVPASYPYIIKFMEACGYSPLIEVSLYNRNAPDVVMIKPLRDKRLIFPTAKKIILRNAI